MLLQIGRDLRENLPNLADGSKELLVSLAL
jgi:hypothetical protein